MKRNCLEFTGQACARRGGGLIVHNVIPEEAVGENELFIVEVTSSQTRSSLCFLLPFHYF